MKHRDLLSILLHRPGTLCRALVDPLLADGDGLELAGGYNGLSRLVGCGNELINPQGGFNVTSTSGGESTQQLPEPPGGGRGGGAPGNLLSCLRNNRFEPLLSSSENVGTSARAFVSKPISNLRLTINHLG
jgi:hypothetical protein